MKKLMVTILSFVVIAAMVSVFSCGKTNPEEPQATNTPGQQTPTYTLTVVATPTNTPGQQTPTYTLTVVATPTITPTYMESLYDFTTDQTESWTVENAFSNKTYNTTEGNNRPGCLQVTGDFSNTGAKGEIKNYIGTATDFTGKTITCWINIPQELVSQSNPYGVQIFVQDATYLWDAKWINITASGWQKYEWVLPPSLDNQDITQIIQVGIQISAGSGSPTVADPVTILFDDINW